MEGTELQELKGKGLRDQLKANRDIERAGSEQKSSRSINRNRDTKYNSQLSKGSVIIPLAEERESNDGPLFMNHGGSTRASSDGNEDADGVMFFLLRVKFVVVAGFGLFADLYDLAVIDMVKNIMAEEYSRDAVDTSFVTTMALVGALVGTIFFGCLADMFGRKKMCIITTVLMIVGALGSSLSYPIGDMGIYYTLGIWRFILGFGIGGEYPLSALLANEMVHARESGVSLNRACSMMVFGSIVAPIVILCCLWAGASYMFTWRFAVAFGAVPAVVAFVLRWRMCETDRFVSYQKRRQNESVLYVKHSPFLAASNMIKSYWRPLGASCGSWFFYMIVSYGLGLFNGTITKELGLGYSINDQTENVLFVNLMALPGTLVGLLCMDFIGRKNLQMIGFGGLFLFFISLAGAYDDLKEEYDTLLLILYGLTKSFEQCALFSIYAAAAEMFPTKIRGVCHGIASSAGIAGAIVGSSSFQPLLDSIGLKDIFFICSGISFIGFAQTYFFMPSYNAEMLTEMAELDDDRILSILYPRHYSAQLAAELEERDSREQSVPPDTPPSSSPCGLTASGSHTSLSSLTRQNSVNSKSSRPLGVFKTKVNEGTLHRMNSLTNLNGHMKQISMDSVASNSSIEQQHHHHHHHSTSRPSSSYENLYQTHFKQALSRESLQLKKQQSSGSTNDKH